VEAVSRGQGSTTSGGGSAGTVEGDYRGDAFGVALAASADTTPTSGNLPDSPLGYLGGCRWQYLFLSGRVESITYQQSGMTRKFAILAHAIHFKLYPAFVGEGVPVCPEHFVCGIAVNCRVAAHLQFGLIQDI